MLYTILLVIADRKYRTSLKKFLLQKGYSVYVVSDKKNAEDQVKKIMPDLVIIDMQIKGGDICLEIQKHAEAMPIFVLQEEGALSIETRATVLRKPIEESQLLMHIAKRIHKPEDDIPVLHVADLELDTKELRARRGNKTIKLTNQEGKLLYYLMRNIGKVVTRKMILSRIWLYSADIETRVVDVYIGYLRKKIDGGNSKKLIRSIRGRGYLIKD